jgi:hypothetical protein
VKGALVSPCGRQVIVNHAVVAEIALTFVLLLQGRNIALDFDGAGDGHCWRNYTDKSKPCDRHASKDVLYTEGPIAQDFFPYRDSVSILYGATAVDDAFFNNMCAP